MLHHRVPHENLQDPAVRQVGPIVAKPRGIRASHCSIQLHWLAQLRLQLLSHMMSDVWMIEVVLSCHILKQIPRWRSFPSATRPLEGCDNAQNVL